MATKKKSKKPTKKKKAAVKSTKRKSKASSKPKKSTAKTAKSSAKTRTAKAKPATKKSKSAKSPAKASKSAPKKAPKATKKAPAKKSAPKADDKKGMKASTAKPKKMTTGKMLPRAFMIELAQVVRDAVLPQIAANKGRDIVGTSASGDATFELDQVAERALLNHLKKSGMPVAYYSEDSGYTTFSSGQPSNLLVIDPIDGTRAAKNGFEGCVVSVCSTRVIERPAIADLDNACVLEIMGNRSFYAEKGNGARVYVDGHSRKIRMSDNADWEQLAWSMTVPARPADIIFPTAARLIDLSSLKGGFFPCNSTSYSLTRLLTGQLDACVDFANRFYRDIEGVVEDHFINAGRGNVMGVCPYDFAAAVLITTEAGCIVTDAYGDNFDDVLLLDSSVSNHRSVIAATNAPLHERLMTYFDTRIQQYEELLTRRHKAKK